MNVLSLIKKDCGNRLQAILLIKCNKLELRIKVKHLKWVKLTTTKKKNINLSHHCGDQFLF